MLMTTYDVPPASMGEAVAMHAEELETTNNGAMVVVYGTLKKGHNNHALLSDAELVGRCAIPGKWDLFDIGWFPAVVRRPAGPLTYVVGEVYKVNTDTLRSLDLLEGHPHFYERVRVDTPWKQAWIYTLPMHTKLGASWKTVDRCWRPSADEAEWIKPLGDPNNGL